ncbi:hypothetical protein ACJMK2_040913 [Sinanodonta woodiana]|uniref:Uncharacterized protein n=1 Tax=Sinanodonta woodiana TaxID=1069815 RepID=A0ABD3W3U2_SINWO
MEELSSKTALAEMVDEMAKPQMDVSQSAHVRASEYSVPGVRYPSLRPIVPTGLSPAMNVFSSYVGPMTQPIPQTPDSFGLPAAKNTMYMPSILIGLGNQVQDFSQTYSFGNRNAEHTVQVLSSLEVICSQAGAVIRQAQSAAIESVLKYSSTLQDITQCLTRSCSLLHDVRSQLMSQIKGQAISTFGGTLVNRAGGENPFWNTQNSTDGSSEFSD